MHKRIWPFIRCFIPHLAVGPVMFFVVITFLHELAHAAMALILGGQVTEFVFLPSADALGHMRWEAPAGAPPYFGDLVSVAPYLMWSASALLVVAIAILPSRQHWLVAAGLFYWMYMVPLGDVAWNLFSGSGDLAVPGFEGLVLQVVGGLALVGAGLGGFFVQRKLFHDRSLGFIDFVVAMVALLTASVVSAGTGYVIFGT